MIGCFSSDTAYSHVVNLASHPSFAVVSLATGSHSTNSTSSVLQHSLLISHSSTLLTQPWFLVSSLTTSIRSPVSSLLSHPPQLVYPIIPSQICTLSCFGSSCLCSTSTSSSSSSSTLTRCIIFSDTNFFKNPFKISSLYSLITSDSASDILDTLVWSSISSKIPSTIPPFTDLTILLNI